MIREAAPLTDSTFESTVTSQRFLKSYKFSDLTVSLPISRPSLLQKRRVRNDTLILV